MSVKEKIMGILGITEAEYNKELARHEYERAKAVGCVSEFTDKRGKNMAMNWKDALAQQQNAMQQAQLQRQYAMAQQQAMMNNAAVQMSGVSGLAQGGYISNQYQQAYPQNYRQTLGSTPKGLMPTFEQLEDPDSPFNLPLEALAVMWGARFGYRWVKDEDTADAIEENEELWSLVASRLLEAGILLRQDYRHPDKLGVGSAWKLLEKDHGNS